MVFIRPPEILIKEINIPLPNIKTNKDLLEYTLELQNIIRQLNNDKRAINEFIRGNINEPESKLSE